MGYCWSLSQLSCGVGKHVGHRADQALHIRNVKELVRAMSIRKRTKDTSHDKLSLRPQFAKECHEGNRATFRDGKRLVSKVLLTRSLKSLAQQWMVFRGVESLSGPCICYSHLGIVRRIFSQSFDYVLDSLLGILCGRKPDRNLCLGERKHHISSCDWLRKSVHSGDCQLSSPAIEDQRLKRIRADALQVPHSYEILNAWLSYFNSQVAQLLISICWDIDIKSFYAACLLILQSLKQASQNSEGGRNDP